jgi:hypothetical protein
VPMCNNLSHLAFPSQRPPLILTLTLPSPVVLREHTLGSTLITFPHMARSAVIA